MKKLIAIAFLSLAAIAANTPSASAFFPCCCYKKCFTCQVNIRPYNAFSPCCFGQLYCDGCAPQSYPGAGYMGHGDHAMPPQAQPMPAAPAAPKAGQPAMPGYPQAAYPQPMPYGAVQPNPYMQQYAPGYPPAMPTSRMAPGQWNGQRGF